MTATLKVDALLPNSCFVYLFHINHYNLWKVKRSICPETLWTNSAGYPLYVLNHTRALMMKIWLKMLSSLWRHCIPSYEWKLWTAWHGDRWFGFLLLKAYLHNVMGTGNRVFPSGQIHVLRILREVLITYSYFLQEKQKEKINRILMKMRLLIEIERYFVRLRW